MSVLIVSHTVAEAHQAVTQMYVFDNYVGMWHRKVIVTEVPVTVDAVFYKLTADFACAIAGQA